MTTDRDSRRRATDRRSGRRERDRRAGPPSRADHGDEGPFGAERTWSVPDRDCRHADRELLATHGLTEYHQCPDCEAVVVVWQTW